MSIYRFTQDFHGTINGRTERHPVGQLIELDDLPAELADVLEVADGSDVADDGTLSADELKAPASRARRVAKKSAAK